jgi:hypothetical protein
MMGKERTGHSGAKWELGLEFILITSGLEGNKDWESFALSAKESATRTRGRVTTTISSVHPATQHGNTTKLRTQSRGTPIDAGDFRGTGLRIMYIVTSCNNRHGAGGVAFVGAEKRGSGKVAKQKLSNWPLQLLEFIAANVPAGFHD